MPEREAGLRASVRASSAATWRDVRAVDGDLVRRSRPGEVVGFLGPNGAGKTTTLKMLSGLLYPTAGEARVLGHVPSKREREYLRRMTLVMGNRNQLQWDLPALDSFELNRAIYRLPRADFTATRDELIELLDVGDLVRKPVRNLSLGERMKVRGRRLAAAPAAGALPRRADDRARRDDAEAHPRVHRRVQPPLRRDRAADEPLHGRRRGALQARHRHPPRADPLRRRRSPRSATGSAPTRRSRSSWMPRRPYGEVITRGAASRCGCRRPRPRAATARLLAEHEVADLTVEDPPIEDVIEQVFAQERPE